MPLLMQSVELLNQVFVLVVDCFYRIVFIKNLGREKEVIEK